MHMFSQVLKNTLGVLFLSLALAPAAPAAPMTPQSLQGAKVITADTAKAMVEKGTLIVDARVAEEYVELHIKGAQNIPYKEKSAKSVDYDAKLDSFDGARLPANKSKAVIFYCNAGECWKSYKAAKAAIKAGYTNVYWLRGGIPEWKAKGYPVE